MKPQNNWILKTLEELENDYWKEPDNPTGLVSKCFQLRRKTLKDFDVEDLRIMIGQNIGLKYLIPLAIDILKDNILAKGDLYYGDLLKNVLSCDKEYWITNINNWVTVRQIFEKNKFKIENSDNSPSIKNDLFNTYLEF